MAINEKILKETSYLIIQYLEHFHGIENKKYHQMGWLQTSGWLQTWITFINLLINRKTISKTLFWLYLFFEKIFASLPRSKKSILRWTPFQKCLFLKYVFYLHQEMLLYFQNMSLVVEISLSVVESYGCIVINSEN